ncbi:MAG: M6 family metalloprotease domain-containing protein [candidate division Zixibacteria bacterium]|nr:M6 family metalloprotease domain-containing protein [candidate division Zixibacteria bacterium]
MRKRNSTALWFFGVLITLIMAARVSAMPPHPDLAADIAAGTVPVPYAIAHRSDLLAHGVDSPVELPGRQGLRKSANSATTTRSILCVLVEFSDKAKSVNPEDFDTLMFVNQVGTVRHYFNEVSYNSYDIVTINLPSSIGWVTAPQTYAYYCNGENGLNYSSYPKNVQKLTEDIINLIDPVVNFANYDNDGDGYVDGVVIAHTGPGAEYKGGDVNYIWSHKWNTHSPMLKDGKYVFEYSIQPEYWSSPGDITLGVFVHELGHLLFGLPDLYDTDYSSKGIGKWSLMAGGSWNGPGGMGGSPAHPDVFSRIQCGFATANNVTSNATGLAIPDVETNSSGAILRLWTNGTIGNQYFLIENRRKIGYDAYLPSEGLQIWHIDENVSASIGNDNEWYPGHTTTGHYLVALEQADNLFALEKNLGSGDAGDPFPGSFNKTSFSGLTSPSSNDYSGAGTLVAVSNISAAGATMTTDLSISLVLDVNDDTHADAVPNSFELGQNYPNPFNPETRIRFNLPKRSHAILTVYNVLGEKVDELVNGELPAGTHEFIWKPESGSGQSHSSGVYFYRLVADEITLTRKMLLMK